MARHKRTRTQQDYDREIEEAAKRMRKYPEHLKAAQDDETWIDFLDNIGVNARTTDSEAGQDYWKKVADKVTENELPISAEGVGGQRWLTEKRVKMQVLYRDSKGHFTKTVTEKQVISYRSLETGRFVSRKSLE